MAKYYLLFGYDVYHEMKSNDPDKMNDTEINKHIFECIKLKGSFPKKNRSRGGIKLFGNNIRLLIGSWDQLKLLIKCDKCKWDPWKNQFSFVSILLQFFQRVF